jgi:glycosyltransferase involved in cell wall biosynthesis
MSDRVAILQQDLRSGGAERMMLNLAREWVGRGVATDLVLVQRAGVYLPLVPPQVRIIDLDAGRTSACLPRLVRYLHKERPRALLSGLVHVNVAAILGKMLGPSGVRLVISERNTPTQDSRDPERATRFGYRLAPYLYRYADAITAVSAGVADDLARFARLPRERIQVINNPVVTREMFELAREPISHPWFTPGSPPVILAVGRLSEAKDYPLLLRAFAQVRRAMTCRLLILGDGALQAELERLAESLDIRADVEFAGFVLNPYSAMSHAALLVLSSRWEGSPNVLVEAMACGLPVVSTDCPSGPREILMEGRYGPLTPVGDVPALVQAIRSTLANPPSSEILRQRAAAYGASHAADNYLNVLLGSPTPAKGLSDLGEQRGDSGASCRNAAQPYAAAK